MLYFSKSRYCEFKQCPKACWLHKHKPEVRQLDESVLERMATGNEVGDLAMGLFGDDFIEVTAYKPDGSLDFDKMKALTMQYVKEGRQIICEAAFGYKGLYCAVDILKKTPNGYAIYEVKSSTSPDKYVYLIDVCYQKYVLEKLGIAVDGVYVVTIDSGYVFDGTLDIQKLFKITDVSELVEGEIGMVEDDLKEAERTLALKEEPDIDLSYSCKDPYECACWNYCSRNLPKPSVFDLYKVGFNKAIDMYKRGVISFEDVISRGVSLNDKAMRQVEFALEDRGTYINKEGIAEFLKAIKYPIYFLDFETIQPAVPKYVGTRPYQQIPVQYSLHILTQKDSLTHREFLGNPESDSREELAKRLISDISEEGVVIVYNKSFECSRLKELAEAFPELAPQLLRIRDSVVDLLDPFKDGYYYNRDMGGSFSIKSVLPAIFPDDPELDYHKLEGVHNGSEAMELYPRLKDMPRDERTIAERNLLKYCELDTYAMVKIFLEMVRVLFEE